MPVDYQVSEGIARYFKPGEKYGDPFIASMIVKHIGRDIAVIEVANGEVSMPDTVELFRLLAGHGIKIVCMSRRGFPFGNKITDGVLRGYIQVDVEEFIAKMGERIGDVKEC